MTKKIPPEKNREYVRRHIAEKLDEIKIRPPKGTKDKWKEAAEKEGKSLQRFIIDTIENHISKDGE